MAGDETLALSKDPAVRSSSRAGPRRAPGGGKEYVEQTRQHVELLNDGIRKARSEAGHRESQAVLTPSIGLTPTLRATPSLLSISVQSTWARKASIYDARSVP